ncbi:hypothetical protein HYPBUDRAFT_120766 [Hyphopichia burtonii NRRL Y-1933]|uniref:CAP-Gly domain-containing protein n=1 Tax=Hyphopichia burtonii NRRL Y-1933 TaxID=984485 RepID=A0A1E4RNN8_9ASCO|nr:hypothetical protein HYPBUDRAFT_120766 [Hyphopichia burtonii NRRL Y-1933]ODV68894.1 hypothetical protein HYPBUDRAFT_120766 [Hyphopichia burtonii NRRL Y-1933]
MSEYIGSKVAIPGTRGYGTLKYYGPIEGKQGLFAGIELTGPIAASRGKNNGSVNGIQYFDVIQPMSGLFLPIDRLKQANPQIGGSKYNDLKLKYDINEREMNEKMEILNELRITVNDLQPLLEEYEIDISEKDKKLSRQKSEFERAREEWRSSIQLLVNTHEETEILYDQKFRELREYIERLLKEKDDISNNNQITTPTSNSSSKKIYHGDDHESEIERLNLVIHDLNLEHHLLEKNYTAKIQNDLNHQLEIRPTFEELSDLQKSLDELDTLHENELNTKSTQINSLSESNKDLENQLNDFKQKNIDLEDKIKTLQELNQSSLIQLESENIAPNSLDGLPIYKPAAPIDPSAGKDDWCGLCERDGHSSINCPYENDVF